MLEGKKRPLASASPALPVAEGHLQANLDGAGTSFGIEDLLDAAGGQRHELPRELDGGDVSEAEEGTVGHPLELLPDGVVDLGNPVAMHCHPQGGDAAQVAAPVHVHQLEAFGPLYHDGVRGDPLLHLREWVPHVSPVKQHQLLALRLAVTRRSLPVPAHLLPPPTVCVCTRRPSSRSARPRGHL